ncbi:MAG TPA: peptide deformylase [Blastocatellia bacterium]|jgi:peptide deformylase|nr:peptide deformylase [Blastocatellia bacterium]
MSTREILQLGNPALLEKSSSISEHASTEVRALARDLSDTLASFRRETGYGRGIAAPQIGVLKRMIFIRMATNGFDGPLINPEILRASEERFELWDDCFSFPDLMVRVSRAATIRVRYEDERGASRVIEAGGDFSELLQHEIDHLDGILAVQRAVSPGAFATRSEWLRQNRP